MPTLSPNDVLQRYPEADRRATVRECADDRFLELKRRIEGGVSWGVGAVVTDDDGRVLLVRERDRWSIPGGGVDDGETHSEAVVREVREETGIDIRVETLHAVTEQTITDGDEEVTFHFATYGGTPETTAITDDPGLDGEGIEAVRWLDTLPENTIDRNLIADVR